MELVGVNFPRRDFLFSFVIISFRPSLPSAHIPSLLVSASWGPKERRRLRSSRTCRLCLPFSCQN